MRRGAWSLLGLLGVAVGVVAAQAPIHTPYDATFARFLPPIFRVVLMTALCILGFGVDMQILAYWGMNPWGGSSKPASVHLPLAHESDSSSLPEAARRSGAETFYLLAASHVAWATMCWLFYRANTDPTTGARTLYAQAWEAATIVGLVALWIAPGPFRPLLRAWLHTLQRLFTPSLRQTISFSDVIAADILTSFAKVLGDVWLSLVVLAYLVAGQRLDDHVLGRAETQLAVPILISVPYLVRFRQCLSEYVTTKTHKTRSSRPLYNALKYMSALPVIWLRSGAGPPSRTVELLWYVSVLVNTLFSFWWDVTNDWGLDLLHVQSFRAMLWQPRARLPPLHRRTSSETRDDDGVELMHRRHARQPSMLRAPEKPLPLPTSIYWVLLAANLVLRFTWSLKLSSHWHYLLEWQRGLLLFEALELYLGPFACGMGACVFRPFVL
ncbi:protein-ER retention protein [Malassezia equina]|uniref:Protein-ER retention protein n=1 Tax=Malassezia equina TaxID=1381935 RepID=A0AAF0IZA2_9BASI|nr:protein-ER retention protein [Malassezia equina]